jgi:hypothetical protein
MLRSPVARTIKDGTMAEVKWEVVRSSRGLYVE